MNRPGLLVEDLDVSWQPYFDRHVFSNFEFNSVELNEFLFTFL